LSHQKETKSHQRRILTLRFLLLWTSTFLTPPPKFHNKRKPEACAGNKCNMIVRIISLFNLYFPFKDEPLTEPVNADVQDDVYVQPHFRVQQISCSFSHSFFSFSIFYFFYVSFSTSLNNLLHRAAWSPRHNVICSFPMTLPSSLYHPFSFLRCNFFPCRFSLLIQS
jgi:hypothetical protein